MGIFINVCITALAGLGMSQDVAVKQDQLRGFRASLINHTRIDDTAGYRWRCTDAHVQVSAPPSMSFPHAKSPSLYASYFFPKLARTSTAPASRTVSTSLPSTRRCRATPRSGGRRAATRSPRAPAPVPSALRSGVPSSSRRRLWRSAWRLPLQRTASATASAAGGAILMVVASASTLADRHRVLQA